MIDSYKKTGFFVLIVIFFASLSSNLMPMHYQFPEVYFYSGDHKTSQCYLYENQPGVWAGNQNAILNYFSNNQNIQVQIVWGGGDSDNYTCRGTQQGGITFASMSSDECKNIFHEAPCEYLILGYFPSYRKQEFRNYARTLHCYEDFMLWLNNKIHHDKRFRKQTAYVPGFRYKHFIFRKKKSAFHDFVDGEARSIQGKRTRLAQLPRLRLTDATTHETLRSAYVADHIDPETTYRYQQRADALKRTIASNGTCSDYASHVPPVSADDKYAEVFSNTYGTPLDCQLHKELCRIRSEVSALECKYSHDAHVQIIAPVIHRFAAQAKVDQSPTVAFCISDFCHDFTRVFSQGLDVLYHYSSAVGRRIVKGAKPVLTPAHWREMAKGTLNMGLLFLDAVGQEDVRQNAVLVAAFSKNYEVLDRVEKNYCLQTKAQSEALHHLACITYDKLKNKSWKELAGDGIELGTTMVLDILALNAAGGFVSTTSRAAVAELSSVMKQGLFTEQYATEVAGFGKLVIEEGACTAKESAALFEKSSELLGQPGRNIPQTLKEITELQKELFQMYKDIPLGKGSTGRRIPMNLNEQLAMKEALSDPLINARELQSITMTDPRWLAQEGWVKMSKNVNGIEIHYVRNKITGKFDDFKFK